NDRAVDVCLGYLRHLGFDWPPHPTEEVARREYDRIWLLLGNRAPEAVTHVAVMREPDIVATMGMLTRGLTPGLYTDTNLLDLILEHGRTDGSCLAYVWLGRLAGSRFGNYRAGFELGRLGCELVERSGLERFTARVYVAFANFCLPWVRPVREGHDLLRRAY